MKKVLKTIRKSEQGLTYSEIRNALSLDPEIIRSSVLQLERTNKIGKTYREKDNEWIYKSFKKKKKKEEEPSSKFSPKDIHVFRGGDWKLEGDQSIFYYKIKVKNGSKFIIANINILVTSIPRGLEAQSKNYQIESLKPDSFESPTFKLNAKESCVGDKVEGIVTYTDPFGTQQSVHIEPFEICYVCNLLSPKEITKQEFDEKIVSMEKKELIIESDLNVTDLQTTIAEIVKDCHFAFLKDMKKAQDENFMKIEAYAEGLYDKQDVALSVGVQKSDNGSKLIIEAMSDRIEKLMDLTKDLSIKLDDVKSNTELILEYTSQIEKVLDNQEDLESFLKERLASDFQKFKYAWQDYKAGSINKTELIKEGFKIIGKKFVKKIIGNA